MRIAEGSNRVPRATALLVGFALAVTLLTTGVARGAVRESVASTNLTLYSVAEQEQYVNNQDDRTRGKGNNPFGNFVDQAPAQVKSAAGPFPGDEAIFSFNVYSDPSLKTRAGSATFVCQYNFEKNAFCDVSLQLDHRGNLIAAGTFNFDASKFTVAVTGGTGAYLNKKGSVRESPSANHAQKLVVELV